MIELTSEHKRVLEGIDGFIFDCDGVIWKGNALLPGAKDAIDILRSLNKTILFVTNNSTKSRKGFQKKFSSLGLEVPISEIFTSSFAAALYFLKHPLNNGQKVYIIGLEGISEELSLVNVPHFGGVQDKDKTVDFSSKFPFEYDKDVGAVVVGLDFSLNYYKIQYAQLCINQNPGCRFIATNTDAVTHLTESDEWAGNGACVGAIIGCTGKQPIVVGKPGSLIIDYIMDQHHISKDRICMVGDRLDTDIMFGLNNGLKTLLTLSGVTSKEDLFDSSNQTHPHYYCNSIQDIINCLR